MDRFYSAPGGTSGWGFAALSSKHAMEQLTLSDFETFSQEIYGSGYKPFPWQSELVKQVVTHRRWPEIVDLPTGAGKTTCIDIALFALALDVSAKARWCPRRIVMVVDRRVVVDQAARRARQIARALRNPTGPVTARVAAALSRLSTEGSPLHVAVLRGGIPRDREWARSPDQPLVLASTVDQLGSRLLFRGYGVSRSMAPVHAGLLDNDTLILLDEVHLSRPFQETLEVLARARRNGSDSGVVHLVSLSATPGETKSVPFGLTREDRKQELLAKRLGTTKPARLYECHGRDELVEKAAKHASELLSRGHATVAVVMNRVDSAHAVARKLLAHHPAEGEVEIQLLTGRMRPLDRDDIVQTLEPRVAATPGRRSRESKSLVVVATQCIEAGADFDFDALVTEHASLDALRQRFGRVDRLGEYQRAEGVVVAVLEQDDNGKLHVPKDDPIYGESLAQCWAALKKLRGKSDGGVLDFGIDALDAKLGKLKGVDASALLAPRTRAPAFFPAYLDLWAQTSPCPIVEPDVPTFLHGPHGQLRSCGCGACVRRR